MGTGKLSALLELLQANALVISNKYSSDFFLAKKIQLQVELLIFKVNSPSS